MTEDERERTENLIDTELKRRFGGDPISSNRQDSQRGSPYHEDSECESSYYGDSLDERPQSPEAATMTFEMIPWETHGATSRREFLNLYLEFYISTVLFQKGEHPPIHILMQPITDIQGPHFVELLADNKSVAVASRTTLEAIVSVMSHDRFRDLHVPSLHKENLSDADQPFCRTWLPWQCPTLQFHTWLPAFYLTSRLTEEQDQEIREEIKKPYGDDGGLDMYHEVGPKDCGFIPWKTDEFDGKVRDIWEICQTVHKESFWRGDDYFICIDQQSAIDKTVIFVVPDRRKVRHRWPGVKRMHLPNLAGFTFARIPGRRAHVEGAETQHFNRYYYPFSRKRYLTPELLRIDRLERDGRYLYVDGDGNPLVLTEDVDSEASPTDPSDNDEDKEHGSVDSIDELVEEAMYDSMYGGDLY